MKLLAFLCVAAILSACGAKQATAPCAGPGNGRWSANGGGNVLIIADTCAITVIEGTCSGSGTYSPALAEGSGTMTLAMTSGNCASTGVTTVSYTLAGNTLTTSAATTTVYTRQP